MGCIGKHGMAQRRQSKYGLCADCDKKEKLIGFLCTSCYNSRYRRWLYRTNKKYREKELKRNEKNRRKKVV